MRRDLHSRSGVRDAVNFWGDPGPIRHGFVKVISANQEEAPAVQILCAAAATVALCEAVGIDPHEMVSRIRRMSSHLDGPFTNQWQAMKDYAKGELL